MQKIIPIPAFIDNYIWLIQRGKHAIVIDPGDAKPVIDYLKQEQLILEAILITHHHQDHCGGVADLLKFCSVPVYAPLLETIAYCSYPVTAGDIISFSGLTLQVIDIPGHTHGHIAYHAPGMVFCGDTLFTGGCGRLFEGTSAQMLTSLNNLAALPDATLIYCGHEYTLANLRFALSVEPDNLALQQRYQQTLVLREQNLPTVPATIALEKQTNPFLRIHIPAVRAAVQAYSQQTLTNPAAIFQQLRLWKDNFQAD